MKKRKDIAKIDISENHPYSIDEKWSTIDADGFFECDVIDDGSKLYLLKEKMNEIIDVVNELKNEKNLDKQIGEKRKSKPGSQ
jgi:hypothetical protein